mgnify:CR=1 FL=1
MDKPKYLSYMDNVKIVKETKEGRVIEIKDRKNVIKFFVKWSNRVIH